MTPRRRGRSLRLSAERGSQLPPGAAQETEPSRQRRPRSPGPGRRRLPHLPRPRPLPPSSSPRGRRASAPPAQPPASDCAARGRRHTEHAQKPPDGTPTAGRERCGPGGADLREAQRVLVAATRRWRERPRHRSSTRAPEPRLPGVRRIRKPHTWKKWKSWPVFRVPRAPPLGVAQTQSLPLYFCSPALCGCQNPDSRFPPGPGRCFAHAQRPLGSVAHSCFQPAPALAQ